MKAWSIVHGASSTTSSTHLQCRTDSYRSFEVITGEALYLRTSSSEQTPTRRCTLGKASLHWRSWSMWPSARVGPRWGRVGSVGAGERQRRRSKGENQHPQNQATSCAPTLLTVQQVIHPIRIDPDRPPDRGLLDLVGPRGRIARLDGGPDVLLDLLGRQVAQEALGCSGPAGRGRGAAVAGQAGGGPNVGRALGGGWGGRVGLGAGGLVGEGEGGGGSWGREGVGRLGGG